MSEKVSLNDMAPVIRDALDNHGEVSFVSAGRSMLPLIRDRKDTITLVKPKKAIKPGDIEKKCYFDDMIKGKIEMPENVIDVVLLKTDGIPTYHFAHAIDDHLMRTTHVTRGDEWIASVPLHLQLFKVLGFKPVKYAHVAPIMKEENGGKRKLSKRKDPEAAVSYYSEVGYPAASVNSQ